MPGAAVRVENHSARSIEHLLVGWPAIRMHFAGHEAALVKRLLQQQTPGAMLVLPAAVTRLPGDKDDLLLRAEDSEAAEHQRKKDERSFHCLIRISLNCTVIGGPA